MSTATTTLDINGFDTATIETYVMPGIDGWRGMPEIVYPTAEIPGAPATLVTGPPIFKRRTLRIPITIRGSSYANMNANRKTLQSYVNASINQDALLVFSDQAAIEYLGRVTSLSLVHTPPDMVTPEARGTLTFECHDPLPQKTTNNVVAVGTGATDVPAGTAIIYPVFRINAAATAPVIILKNNSGVEQHRFGMTGLGGATWVDVNMKNQTILDQAGASKASLFDPATEFFGIDPDYWDYPTSDWATVEKTGAAGTLNCTYRIKWWS